MHAVRNTFVVLPRLKFSGNSNGHRLAVGDELLLGQVVGIPLNDRLLDRCTKIEA